MVLVIYWFVVIDLTKENVHNCVIQLYAEFAHSVSATAVYNHMSREMIDRRIYIILNELVEEKRLTKSDSGYTPIGETVTE